MHTECVVVEHSLPLTLALALLLGISVTVTLPVGCFESFTPTVL